MLKRILNPLPTNNTASEDKKTQNKKASNANHNSSVPKEAISEYTGAVAIVIMLTIGYARETGKESVTLVQFVGQAKLRPNVHERIIRGAAVEMEAMRMRWRSWASPGT